MIIDLNFKRNVNFLGRNGMFNQSGIAIQTRNDRINLQPFTSKGNIGRAMLEIPLEDVPSVIAALQKVSNSPAHDIAKTLTDNELLTILEAGRQALADGDIFDSIGEAMDLSDSDMKGIQAKLEGIMNADPDHWKK